MSGLIPHHELLLRERAVPLDLADFLYVDTAVGGVDRRNHVMLLCRFAWPPGAREVFTTYLRFTRDLQDYAATNPSPTTGRPPSVANYPGPAYAPRMVF